MSGLSTVSFLQYQIFFIFDRNILNFPQNPLVTETLQSQTATASFQTVRTECSCHVWNHNIARCSTWPLLWVPELRTRRLPTTPAIMIMVTSLSGVTQAPWSVSVSPGHCLMCAALVSHSSPGPQSRLTAADSHGRGLTRPASAAQPAVSMSGCSNNKETLRDNPSTLLYCQVEKIHDTWQVLSFKFKLYVFKEGWVCHHSLTWTSFCGPFGNDE